MPSTVKFATTRTWGKLNTCSAFDLVTSAPLECALSRFRPNMTKFTHLFFAVVLSVFCTNAEAGLIEFNFTNGGPFDETEVGDYVTVSGLRLTIRGIEYRDLTGVDSIRDTPGSLISRTGDFQGDNSGFGIDNETITAGNFASAFGPSNEQNRFNDEESLIFDFDKDVTLSSIDFGSFDTASESFVLQAAGMRTEIANADTGAGDVASDPFSGAVIAAGTDIRLSFEGLTSDFGSLQALSVSTSVPEPTSMILFGVTSIGLLLGRRRKR